MKHLKIYVSAFCIFALAVLAYPQIRESGAIQGNVTDKTGAPMPGVSISLTGTSLIGGARAFVTDAKGSYRFPSIPPGPYTVTAELTGFAKMVKEAIRLHAGVTLTVDFVLEEAKLEKEVLVTAVSPTIDTQSSTTAPIIMTDQLLLATPAINSPDSGAKSFFDILNLAPGVDYYGAYGSGYSAPNAYQFDGVNTPGNVEPDYNIISEASVQAFGLPAEYGDFTGVVFNAITKSGSNKFSGLAEFRYNGKSWNSQNITAVPTEDLYDPSMKSAKQYTDQHMDIGLQVGGPILKDKLWFFLSGEYYASKKNPVGTTVRPKWYSPKFYAKLSFQLNPSNRVNFGFNYDNEKADNIVAGPQFPVGVSLYNNYPGYVINTNWTSIFSPNTFLDVKLGYSHKNQDQLPTAGMDISGHLDLATGMWSGNYPSFYSGRTRYLDSNVHLSHYIPELIKGSHDIKMGVEYRYAKEATGWGYVGPDHTFYLDLDGQPYLAYQKEGKILDKYSNTLAGFIEDSWKISKNLITNLGLRLTNYRYKLPSPNPGVIFTDTAIAPRIGLNYNFSDNKTVLKLHYGHYYDKFDSYWFYGTDLREATTFYKMWNGTEYEEYNRAEPANYSLDPNIKMPFMREYTVALERELFKDASLSLSFFYRNLARAIGPINTLGEYEKITIVNPGPDGIEGTGDDSTIDVWNQTNPGENAYLITNPKNGQSPAVVEEPKHTATGFQAVFNKRFSNRWQATISYVYTSAKGNIQRPPYTADLGKDPNYFINESGPNARYSGQPHYFKALATYLFPLDINLGVYFYYISPHTYRPDFGAVLDQGYVTIYAEPWGVYKVNPQRNINIDLAKIFKLSNVTLTVMADVYNLLNSHDVRWDYDVFSTYGEYFGKIMNIQQPRTFRLGFRVSY